MHHGQSLIILHIFPKKILPKTQQNDLIRLFHTCLGGGIGRHARLRI